MGAVKIRTFGGGQSASKYCRQTSINRWVNSKKNAQHGLNSNDENEENIQFAKDLFLSWDDDGSGTLEADEIIKPLISLGLASDAEFAKKIIEGLDNRQEKER